MRPLVVIHRPDDLRQGREAHAVPGGLAELFLQRQHSKLGPVGDADIVVVQDVARQEPVPIDLSVAPGEVETKDAAEGHVVCGAHHVRAL